MYILIDKAKQFSFITLDEAMQFAKTLNSFVTIKGNSFEVCGKFGVDSIENGICPDGIEYSWNKASRIGQDKKFRG